MVGLLPIGDLGGRWAGGDLLVFLFGILFLFLFWKT